MDRQKLEEKIANGESVWVINDKFIKEIKLDHKYDDYTKYSLEDQFGIHFLNTDRVYINERYYDYDNIFATKEDAEWELNYGNIERTERLRLPTYEKIEQYIENMKKFGLNRNDKILARIVTSASIYYLKLCKDFDLFTFQLKQTYIGDDLCKELSIKLPRQLGNVTKQNYIEACELAKKLFLGEGE